LRRPLEFAQYTSLVFTRRCRSVGIDVSMGSRGDCFDTQLSIGASVLPCLV
jgi:hypothetical protein